MLRITLDRQSGSTTMKLEGRLRGPWVEELERTWHHVAKSEPPLSIVVDLSDVTYIDSEGKKLLGAIFQQGADLRSGPLMTQFILSEIKQESKELCAP